MTKPSGSERWIRIASRSIGGAGSLLIIGLGLHRVLKDGSLWVDEALVARSVQLLSPLQYFGVLDPPQNFPRLYLLAIRGLVELFGYETGVLRALPFVFFVLGTLLWIRLLSIRNAKLPLLLVVAILLNLIPTPWLLYSSLFKQYTLDVFLAMGVFSIPDRKLESILIEGKRPWRAALLMLPWVVSYAYIIVLFGRCAGFWLSRLRGGRGGRPSFVAGSALAAGVAVFGGILYATDIQHTLSDPPLFWWRRCLLTSSRTTPLEVLDRFTGDWYRGKTEFPEGFAATPVVIAIQVLLVLGILFVLWRFAANTRDPYAEGTDWGSRSLAALCTLAVLVIASVPLNYPLCANRLTLFVLLPMQLMILEGVIGLRALLIPRRGGRVMASAMITVLALSLIPAAVDTVSGFAKHSPPLDLRKVLPFIQTSPKLQVVMDPCTWNQARSLPDDWVGLELIVYKGGGRFLEKKLRREKNVWVLTHNIYCPTYGTPDKLLGQITSDWQAVDLGEGEVRLFRARTRLDSPLLEID